MTPKSKQRKEKKSIVFSTVDARYIVYLFPLLMLIGKVVRWTIMKDSLINLSKGWGYIDMIISSDVSISFFEIEDLLEGDIGSDRNMYLVFKLVRFLFFNIPDDFYEFEIAITIIWGALLFCLCTYIRKYITVVEFLFVCLGIMALNVYSFSLAKEPFQMLYFYLLFWVIYSAKVPENRKLLAGCGVIFLSVATFRTYYVLILLFAIVALVILKWMKLGILGMYLGLVGTYCALMQCLKIVLNSLYIRMVSCLLYASDATSSSNTYIENVITDSMDSVILVTLEYALMVIRLLFPLEVLPLGIKYWPYVIYQICISVLMIQTIQTYETNSKIRNIALVFFIGFVFASATFEVDYGAWIRHEAVTFPLVLLMAGVINRDYIKVYTRDEVS